MTDWYKVLYLLFVFSFLGWVMETAWAAITRHKYVDRSVLFGPLCVIYGFGGVTVTVLLQDLKGGWFFLFLGSMIYTTVIEWVGGHILEAVTQTRWWDYSGHRFHLDGYVSLKSSVLWGLLGVTVVRWGVPLLLAVYGLLPVGLVHGALLVLLVLLALDAAATALALSGTLHRLPRMEAVSGSLEKIAVRLGRGILRQTEKRIWHVYPEANLRPVEKKQSTVFAEGCSFYKIVLLFFIGALLGDITETLFCRLVGGVWMSRSSVVWGPFSLVWGLALALATWMLYRYKDRSDRFLFCMGTFLGGAYEYLCSVFTELVFGTVFWDYSKIPFNLGGRINLLYCFFWGFAAVVWFRVVYPKMSGWIEKIPMKPGKVVTWVLICFMAANVAVSAAALGRYTARAAGLPPQNGVESYMDAHYDDARMEKIYPNAIMTD